MAEDVRKWLWLAGVVVVESASFLACGGPDDVDDIPMIGDCMQGCGEPPLAGGGTSGGGTNGTADAQTGADAGFDANTAPDGLSIVDVGVQPNDAFGDQSASGIVDVGVTKAPVPTSGESPPTSPPP